MQRRGILRRLFGTPLHWVYILSHGLLIVGGYALWQQPDLLLKSVAASLISAGVAGWVIFVYVAFATETKNQLKVLSKFGIVNAFDRRASGIKPQYDSLLEGARRQIDIIGFGLRAMREDYGEEIRRWPTKAPVRILLPDPDFPDANHSFTDQRDIEERDTPGTIRSDVERFVREYGDLIAESSGHSFAIRLYRVLPNLNIFRVDGTMLWGPYLVKTVGRNTPTFMAQDGGVVFDQLVKHFDAIWTDDTLSRDVPEEWLN